MWEQVSLYHLINVSYDRTMMILVFSDSFSLVQSLPATSTCHPRFQYQHLGRSTRSPTSYWSLQCIQNICKVQEICQVKSKVYARYNLQGTNIWMFFLIQPSQDMVAQYLGQTAPKALTVVACLVKDSQNINPSYDISKLIPVIHEILGLEIC